MVSLMLGSGRIPYRSWLLGLRRSPGGGEIFGAPINMGIMFLLTAIIGTLFVTIYVYLGAKGLQRWISALCRNLTWKSWAMSKHLSHRMKRIISAFVISMLLSIYGGSFTGGFASFLNDTLTMGGLYCLIAVLLMVLPSGDGDGKACIVFNDIKHSRRRGLLARHLHGCDHHPPGLRPVQRGDGCDALAHQPVRPIFEGRSAVFIVIFTIIVMFILTNVGSNIAFGTAMIRSSRRSSWPPA